MRLLPLIPLLVCSFVSAQVTSPGGEVLNLDVVATTKNGPPIAGLQQQDFTVLDNKVPQPITSFREVGPGAPAKAILVLDAVNSGQVTLGNERQQLDKFLSANEGKLAIPTTLALLTDKGVEGLGGSTLDGLELKKIIDSKEIGLRFLGRGSGFYGAEDRLGVSLQGMRLLASREAQSPGRKLMIWISPGWPVLSGPNIDLSNRQHASIFAEVVQLSTMLRRSGVVLYSVDPRGAGESIYREDYYKSYAKGIRKPGDTDPGNLALQTLVEQTGGLVLNSNNDITSMLKRSVADAAPFYQISFAGAHAERPNEYHEIEVRVGQPEIKARTRQGYYAQPLPGSVDRAPDGPATK